MLRDDFMRTFRLEGTVSTGEQTEEAEDGDVSQQHVEAIPLRLAAPAKEVEVPGIQGVGGVLHWGEDVSIAVIDTDKARLHDPADERDRGYPGTQPVGEGGRLQKETGGDELQEGHCGDGDVAGPHVLGQEDHHL